ncbi:MAG: hypothetical protein R3D30_14310 [Hyphomicrobiales bacterium]
MSAGYDAEVAELFRDLRAASNLTETDLAARIATPIEVVQALEQGALYALPPWPETCRVVNAYGTLLNLDTRPLLRRIYAQLEAGIVELRPKAMPDMPTMTPQAAPQAPWPNGPQAAPQPRAPSPQAPAWPGGAPQFPQGGMPGGQAPQAPWPNGPQQMPPQPQARPAQPRAPQPQARPQPHPQQPQRQQPQGYPQPQPQGYPQQPQAAAAPLEDAFMDEGEKPKSKDKAKRPALLKWGLIALVASVVLVGLWLALGSSSGPSTSSGVSNGSEPVLDPDDPRSRKADRLPNNF